MLLMTAAVAAAPVTTLPIPGGLFWMSHNMSQRNENRYYIIDLAGTMAASRVMAFALIVRPGRDIDGNECARYAGPINVTYDNFGTTAPNLFVNSLESITPPCLMSQISTLMGVIGRSGRV